MQAIHLMRSQCLRDRTALSNSKRGLLGEYGISFSKGLAVLRRKIPELLEDADNGLSLRFRNLLARRYEQLVEIDEHIAFYTKELELLSKQDDACQRLQTIPGFGPIVASVFRSTIGDGCAYVRGRHVAASLGMFLGSTALAARMFFWGSVNEGINIFSNSWSMALEPSFFMRPTETTP